MDPLGLLSPEVMEEIVVNHPWHFLIWSAVVFFLGYQFGKRKAGFVTFYDLNRHQRSMLAKARDGPVGPVEVSFDVMELLDHGLIAEEHGYYVDMQSNAKRFVATVKGNRMLRYHPIGRRKAAHLFSEQAVNE